MKRAIELTVDFPRNNALACLLLEADSDGEDALVNELLLEIERRYSDEWEDGDKAYYAEIRQAALA